MSFKNDWKAILGILGVFAVFYWLPVESPRLQDSVVEALALANWYAREHVILCLVPAFFIAGAIGVFLSRDSVMKYLGARAKKVTAYAVASVSGSILAVCSCTVLPLFAGIYGKGAGLGPAAAFLYSGPAINVLAMILTARVLGLGLGVARAVGAVSLSIVIGLLMHLFFRKEEIAKAEAAVSMPEPRVERPLWKNVAFFGALVAILVFANWGKPGSPGGISHFIFEIKWFITGAAALVLACMLVLWLGARLWHVLAVIVLAVILAVLFPDKPVLAFSAGALGFILLLGTGSSEAKEWLDSTWGFARQILPLLFIGVLVSGALFGRPGHESLIPSRWIYGVVGGNSIGANLLASVVGAFMYFATLTEVPILQGLIGSGMGKGPALALLLAGPALSLPSMLVIRSVLGTRKTFAYVSLVIVAATVSGLFYGWLVG